MKFPEHYRQSGPWLMRWDSKPGDPFGLFIMKRHGEKIKMVASSGFEPEEVDGSDEETLKVGQWEHVSVSLEHRCPTWEEMCIVKNLFWDEEETVIQIHPPRSQYVNYHPFCLHLWRYRGIMPAPPAIAVGPTQT